VGFEKMNKEMAKHATEGKCWIIIDNKVYDVSKFLHEHPGGEKVILKVVGQDASKQFHQFHKADVVLAKYGPGLLVGELGPSGTVLTTGAAAKSPANSQAVAPVAVPYGDPSWYQGWNSPYFTDSHRKFRDAMRAFVDKEIIPFAHEWDETKRMPSGVLKACFDAEWLPGVIGAPWPVEYVGSNIVGGVSPEEFDAFYELILIDEVSRCGSGGVMWGLFVGLCIGLPPVMLFGSRPLKDKVCGPCLRGEKVICLCVTEPTGGSDVANLQTTATRSADGRYFIVNGEKKWITNGVFADFFTVAVRTGGPGAQGISFLLLERSMPGITTRQMKCSGVWPSGTTYITFEDVQVPVENLIGEENAGFKYIMFNFNHERWMLIIESLRFARVCLEDSLRYATRRETFGKKLIEHPVIRLKLAHMARQIEATQAWLENVTYQMKTMPKEVARERLGSPLALLKAQTTITFEFCAREAAQIFGGLAYTRGGQGERVERLYREVRAYAIGGGSEEIMLDLGIRSAMKNALDPRLRGVIRSRL